MAWIVARNASEPKLIFISIADVRKIHQVKVRLRPSHEVDAVFDGSKRHLCEMRYVALRPGTYRFSYGYGCNASHLARLDFELETGKFRAGVRQTGFASSSNVEGFTQDGVCIYIPIGTRSLDLDVWDSNGTKTVALFRHGEAREFRRNHAKWKSALDRLTELHSSPAKSAALPGLTGMVSHFRISIPCLRTGPNRLISCLCLEPS